MSTIKILSNADFGGFGFSTKFREAAAAAGIMEIDADVDDLVRDDRRLIDFVQEYGISRASGPCSSLKVVEIPSGVEWQICEHDGSEWVAEKHRTWR